MSGGIAASDVVGVCVEFVRKLRDAGLVVGVDQAQSFATALTLVDATSRDEVYAASRATLLTRRRDREVFDALFASHWGGAPQARPAPQKVPRAPRHAPGAFVRPALATLLASRSPGGEAKELDIADRSETASWEERLALKDFGDATDEELAAMKRLLARKRWPALLRQTRRRVPTSRGDDIDMRRTLRRAASQGGHVLRIHRCEPKVKPRPLVLVADISGSMQRYSRILLQFFHGLSRSLPRVESFVFGTRLSCITSALRTRRVDAALDAVCSTVVDFDGGTRIGECLGEFNRRWSTRVLRRGAVVLVVSDGWECGDATRIPTEMRFLQRRCSRLIWLNPLLGRRGYRPLVAGMAAAMPFIDDFLPANNITSLSAVADHLGRLPKRRDERPATRAAGLENQL